MPQPMPGAEASPIPMQASLDTSSPFKGSSRRCRNASGVVAQACHDLLILVDAACGMPPEHRESGNDLADRGCRKNTSVLARNSMNTDMWRPS